MVVSKLDALKIAKSTGDLPQSVNFATFRRMPVSAANRIYRERSFRRRSRQPACGRLKVYEKKYLCCVCGSVCRARRVDSTQLTARGASDECAPLQIDQRFHALIARLTVE